MDDRSVPGRTPPYSWYVVGVLTLANVSANVDQQILGALVGPIKRDFGISDVQISYLTGLAFAVFYSVMGLPIARLADRSNRRNIMTAGVTLWSLFTALCATATTYGRLFVMRIGVGVGEAALLPPSVSMIADYVPRERLGRAMSIYSLGVFLGSGIGYFLAGWIVTLVSVQGDWIVPVIGVIRPWQSVFLAVGLPGLLVAALLLTVREPLRRGASGRAAVPLRVFVRYLRENRRTFLTHGFGFGLSSLVNFSLAFWIPSFFARTYGWQEAAALRVMGLLTMTLGVGGVLAGGWVTDWFVRRGHADGPLRAGMIAAAGMLVSVTACVSMPTATLAVAWLAVVNVFAAFPWGAASAASAEIVPSPLRAQGVALYFFVLNLVGRTLGPTSVAFLNDHVFGERGVRRSLAVVAVVAMSGALLLFASGLGSYRRTIENRDRWQY
jgi:MFS family permease